MKYQNKKIIIVGGSGFIGTQLALKLQNMGAQIVTIDPFPSKLESVQYVQSDLQTFPEDEILKNPFAVFNLAGVPIFGNWTAKYKRLLRQSRIGTTQILVEQFKNPEYQPEFFVSTSAIGVYGDRGDERLDEKSELVQNTFLAQLAYDWEQEALRAQDLGIQVRIVRNGHVLGRGGLLSVLKKIFMIGIGGSLGNGKQYMSFVSIDACVNTYVRALEVNTQYLNAVSIDPITNKEFSKKLAHILRKPCLFRIPVWAMRFLYGDFAKEIVTSQKVYTIHPALNEDLHAVLKQNL